jgi:hypothetical protein
LTALQTQDDDEGHFVCVSGWTSDSGCTVDGQSARLQCEPGIVSVKASGEQGMYTVTAADVPLPSVSNTGPDFGQDITIKLIATTGDHVGSAVWTQLEQSRFDWADAEQTSNTLAISVAISGASSIDDPTTITTVQFQATDAAGNVGTCDTLLHVSDVDECADGTHTCHETAVCEDLFDMRGDPGSLTEHVVTGTYNCTCPEGAEGDGYTGCAGPSFPHVCLLLAWLLG